jgi:periplasmic protein TonB
MHPRQHTFNLPYVLPGLLATLMAALLAGCSSPRAPAPIEPPTPAQMQSPASPPAASSGTAHEVSNASNARAYRADAAAHLYKLNRQRIYKGRMPPLLYAVGVLQVEVDGQGNVRHISWMRAPRQAPEVMAEIEHMVRAAAPFPAPTRMGRVVYTDTWLWHKSGKFQLDTLTEGQD